MVLAEARDWMLGLIVGVRNAHPNLRLDVGMNVGEPLDLFGYASGNCGIKLGKVLKRLRRELNLIGQARFSLFFTSSNGIRSEEPRDDWSRA